MKNLPKEGDSQRIGRLAKKALANHMPHNWIDKEQDGDSDYGIDYLIQLKNSNSQVKFSFYLQLKGTTSPKYNAAHTSISYDFKTSTLEYYHRQEPLVMVAVVDICNEQKLYECPIYYLWLDEKWFEENAKRLKSQQTISISIPKINLLNQKLDIYNFYANRYKEKLAFAHLKRGIDGLKKPILETIGLIAETIDEKPIFLQSIELKNEAPWIDNPKDETPTDLKCCSDYLSNNRIQDAKELLKKLDAKQDNFNDHELAEFYYQKANLLSYEGFFDQAQIQFKLAQEKSTKNRYRLAYLESKFKLDSMPSQEELEELADKLGNDNFTECALKAKTLAILKRPLEALELLKKYYPTEIMIQMVICTIGYLYIELDEIIEENIDNDFDDDRKNYIFNALAARRYFHKSSNDTGIDGEILPIEGRPDYDLEGMKQAFSFLQKGWITAKKLGYPTDITTLTDISPLIYGYFGKLEELIFYFDEILSERTSHLKIIRIYVLILFNCRQYQRVIELLEGLESLDATECGMHILSYNHLNRPKQCLSLIAQYESILLGSSGEHIPAIFCIGAEIADAMFNKSLATRYEKIVESFPDGEAYLAIQDFVKKSNEDRNRHKEFTQNLYQKYNDLDKPLIIAEQLIGYLDPRDSITANQLIELAETVLEIRELSGSRYLDLAQAFMTTERWADAERLAIKNINKGIAISKWKLVQAAALQNQGKVGSAYNVIHDVMQAYDIDKQQKKFYISLCLSLGLFDNVIDFLEDNLITSQKKVEKIFIIRRLIAIYRTKTEYTAQLHSAIIRFGDLVDQDDCELEGEYLQLCLLNTPFDDDIQIQAYHDRLQKYQIKFPNSHLLRSVEFNIEEGVENFITSLRQATGITPEIIQLWEENKSKLRKQELPIPFFMRGDFLQDTRDLFTTWMLSKSTGDDCLEFKIIQAPQGDLGSFNKLLESSIPILEETTLLILNEIDLLSGFLHSVSGFSITESLLSKINITANGTFSIHNHTAIHLLKAIQQSIPKLQLININDDNTCIYDSDSFTSNDFLITDDLYLVQLIHSKHENLYKGNIFNVLEYMYCKGILNEADFFEKIVSCCQLGIVQISMRLDFLARIIEYYLGRDDVFDYTDTDFRYIFDKIMLIHSNFENKYKLFLDIFLYVNIRKINAQTLLTLIYKLLENEDTYKPQSVMTTWLIYLGLGKECEKNLETKISDEHLILWNKYVSAMRVLNPKDSSTESLLGDVVLAILKLDPNIKSIAFNNLQSGFSLDSIEYRSLKKLDHLF